MSLWTPEYSVRLLCKVVKMHHVFGCISQSPVMMATCQGISFTCTAAPRLPIQSPPPPPTRTWYRSFCTARVLKFGDSTHACNKPPTTSQTLRSPTVFSDPPIEPSVSSKHLVQKTLDSSCLPSPSTNTPCSRHLDRSRAPNLHYLPLCL